MLIIYQEHMSCRSLLMKNANKYMETIDIYVEFSELETDKLNKELLSKMEQLSSLLQKDRTYLEKEILRVKEERLREELKQYVLQHELEKLRAEEREEQLRGELQRLGQMLIIDDDNVILLREELQKIKEKYQIIDEHFTHLWTAFNTMEPAQTLNSQGDLDTILKVTEAIETEHSEQWTEAEDRENIFELVAQAIKMEDTPLKYPARNTKEDLENNIYAIVAKAIKTEGTLLQYPIDLEKLVEVTEHVKNETKKIAACMRILHHKETLEGKGIPITAEFQIPNSLSLEKQVNRQGMEIEDMLSDPEFKHSQAFLILLIFALFALKNGMRKD
ncbi:hypothetical protein JOB18_044958 [Solea senegalensis]|uniref:Uncharacterized protein n=1 Tax=Solea senegalensis TaxID=28829 RepID=A0AAV6SPG7_SOLSE|nr:hypothetical protein JOB18_044958 [Solea senegalensis]